MELKTVHASSGALTCALGSSDSALSQPIQTGYEKHDLMTSLGALRRPGFPESLADVAWMVALIPLAFAAFFALVLVYLGACADTCDRAPDGYVLARDAWVVGCASWFVTFLLPRPRTSLLVASVGFLVPLVVAVVGS